MINSFSIENAGPIKHLGFNKTGGINLLVGPNSCGKTFVLKLLYSAIRAVEEANRGKEFRSINEILANKLYWTFQADKIGDLVTKGSPGPLKFSMNLTGNDFTYSFGKDTNKQISNVTTTVDKRVSYSIFLPAKETLSIHNVILDTRLNKKSFGFDDTYLDLALAMQSKSSGNEEFTDARIKIEDMLGGRIEFDEINKQWFFKKNNIKYAIGTTAEGIKKVAILDTLLVNRYLDQHSIVFIDEPESALHPKAISQFLEIVFALSKAGIQFFMATHSFFVIKKLYLLAQEHNVSIPISCMGDDKWNVSDLVNEMPENSIIDESIELYKQEVNMQFKS